MSFLLWCALFGAAAFAGAQIGDPTFRPDRDAGHWVTIVRVESYSIGGTP